MTKFQEFFLINNFLENILIWKTNAKNRIASEIQFGLQVNELNGKIRISFRSAHKNEAKTAESKS